MRNKILSTLVITSIIVVLLAFFLNTLGIFEQNVKTYPATMEKLKVELEKEAFVFRDEIIIGALEDGILEYYVEEGERVFAGQPLARLTPSELLEELDSEGNKVPHTFEAPEDLMINIEGIRSNIRSLEDELSYLVSQNKYDEIEDVQERLSSLYLIQSAFKDGKELNISQPITRSSYQNGQHIYYASQPGLVGLTTSSYDQFLNLDNIHLINYSRLEDIPESDVLTKAYKGQGFLRIVDNKESFIVAELSEAELSFFQEGRLSTILIDGARISAENYQILRTEQQTVIVFRIFEDYPAMTSHRNMKVMIIPEETEGILVKTKSIFEQDGQPGVYILKNNGSKVFLPIKIKGKVGDEVVIYSDYFTLKRGESTNESIETVNLYDEIVEEP
ncbi:MAG TPA: HlyD family efflux transporter periplasmic adaptor subunit [Clostridia bacterium]|nr:HlyD family efflux transporter periplasmic adaptor subunit [Clostridia bacterium]